MPAGKSDIVIFNPKPGQPVTINYKDKAMDYQDIFGIVKAVGIGPGPRNVLLKTYMGFVIVPRGNINTVKERN